MSALTRGTALQAVGLVLEVGGALCLSYAYFAIARPRDLPRAFLSALVRGRFARGICAIDVLERPEEGKIDEARRGERNRLRSLQGLSLLVLGFLMQAIGLVTA